MAKHRAKDTSKSAVSNGTRIWPTDAPVDGRAATARRMRDLLDALAAQRGGTFNRLDVMTQSTLRRCAALMTLLEADEAKLAADQPVDAASYLMALDRLNNQLAALGIPRRAARHLDDEADERTQMKADADDFQRGLLAALEEDGSGEPEPRHRLRDRIVDESDDGVVYVRPARSEADD